MKSLPAEPLSSSYAFTSILMEALRPLWVLGEISETLDSNFEIAVPYKNL